ncbi:MAG TPA: amino acid ABC transporter substrate-binding protein [Devosiaceae bacterium]|nr:amino acid ABC transporter substrate-binding protein [Devosiaceae bacterium]
MKSKLLSLFAVAALALTGTVSAASAGTLDQVKAKGFLQCGVETGLPGFGIPDQNGNWTGLDVDYCRAVASAIFGDPTKVKFTPLDPTQRFPALQSGEIDLLVRNTTWTMSRDTQLGFMFAGVNYYDGQGFMVKKELNVAHVKDLDGASICVAAGTDTEFNLADYFKQHNLKYNPVVFQKKDDVVAAYDSGRCDAFTTDASGLYAYRLQLKNPDDNIILPEVISKEPLGPLVRQDDVQWFNIVKWTHYALLNAEELGVTKENVDDMLKSANPAIQRLLGVTGDFGKSMGLDAKWAYNIIKNVGNYGEIFEKDVGKDSPLKIDRGLNNLWNNGGIQYGMPIV